MRTHRWSVRNRIVALLLVPLTSLAALWFVAMGSTLDAAMDASGGREYREHTRPPADRLVSELQRERAQSLAYLGGSRAQPKPLAAQRARTDGALAAFRRSVPVDSAPGLARQRLRDLRSTLETLTAARETIDRGELDRAGAMRLYTAMTDAAYRFLAGLVDADLAGPADPALAVQAGAVVGLGRARDALAQEDAWLAGALAAGRFRGADHGELVQTVGRQRLLFADATADLPAAARTAYRKVLTSEAAGKLHVLEDKLVAEGRTDAPVPVDAAAWRAAYDPVAGQLRDVEKGAGTAVAAATRTVGDRLHSRLWLAGCLGLAGLLLSAGVAWWLITSLTAELARVRQAATHLAHRRLPDVLGRVRRGDNVNLALEASPRYGTDEIGRVGTAFEEVRRVALDAVVEEARLRQSTSAVVRTITWRQQRLLRRQLALLDGVERRITDPADLEDLLRLDHLATRIRRHAEDLAVLIGAIPGRGWTRPVPLVDVARGALSEIEDYARVDVGAVAEVALVGRAVGDTIHLLAELIENACTFSPAESRVRVTADLVPNGLAIEVEDRGEGMSQAATAEANARLAAPGDRSSDRLGLYVVGQLAVRHAIQVHLRPSAYGGITAVVLVPPELVAVGTDQPPADDVAPADLADEIEVLFDADPVRRHLPAPAAPEREPLPARVPPAAGTGLPKRVRQASLAPQLREPAAEESPATPAPARSPETLRSMLSAFQDGTARGRHQSEDP